MSSLILSSYIVIALCNGELAGAAPGRRRPLELVSCLPASLLL